MLRPSGIKTLFQRGAFRPRAACFGLFLVTLSMGFTPAVKGQAAIAQENSTGTFHECFAGCGIMAPQSLAAERPEYRGFTGWSAAIQDGASDRSDHALLHWVNRRQNPVFAATMRVADASFYPIAFGSVPAYWAVALLSEGVPSSDAVHYSIGWAATAGSTLLLKRVIARERPFVSDQDLIIRYSASELNELGDTSSMPSGHSSMSVFAATYLAIQVDTPAATIGGGLWASSVVVSRVWNGVHFPSDVLAGSVLGAGVALLVRHLD